MFEKIKLKNIIGKIKKNSDSKKIEILYNNLESKLKDNIELCDLIFQKDNTLLKILPFEYQLNKLNTNKDNYNYKNIIKLVSNDVNQEHLKNNISDTYVLSNYIDNNPDFLKEYLLNNLELLNDITIKKYARETMLNFLAATNLLDKIINNEEILKNNELVFNILKKDNNLMNLVSSEIRLNFFLSETNHIYTDDVSDLKLFQYLTSKEKELAFIETINRKGSRISNNELEFLISKMDAELQKKVALINLDFIKYCNKEVQLDLFYTDNTLIKYLDENTRIEALNEIPNAIDNMREEIINYSFKDLNNLNVNNLNINDLIKSSIFNAKGSTLDIASTNGNYDMFYGINQYTKSQYDFYQRMSDEQIARLCMYDTNYILPIANVKQENLLNAKSRIKNIFKLIYGEEIQKKYSELIDVIMDNYHFDCINNPNCIIDSFKIIFNKDIIKRNNVDLINKYIISNINNSTNKELFNNIIENAYGNNAKEILNSRINLNEHNINSLEIFNPIIVEKFGIGLIHDLISYNISNMSYFLSLVKDNKKLSNLSDLYELESNIYGKNISTFQRTLNDYDKMESLLNDIGENELSDVELNNLYSLIINRNYGEIIKKDDLINYENIVKDKLLKEISNITNLDYIKEKICLGIFGNNYKNNTEKNDENVFSYLKMYNASNAYNNDLLTLNEKIMLDFIDVISKENNKNIIIELITNLFQEKNVLGNIDFITAFKKIKNNQEKLLNDNLVSVEKLENELSKDNGNVIKIFKNGVPIYILNGIDFGILRHNIGGTNNGYIYNAINNGNSLDNIEKFEEQFGSSTISMSYSSNNRNYITYDHDILKTFLGFGYSKIPDNAIVGMDAGKGTRDISTEHAPKLTTSFAKNGSINFDEVHNSNRSEEVSMYRRLRNQELITNENLGGRYDFDYFSGFINVSNLENLENLSLHIDRVNVYEEAKKRNIPIILVNCYAYAKNKDNEEKIEIEKGISK